jgi:hypothetical protein
MICAVAQTIVIQLIDDLDGSHADETVTFSVDGKAYEIELSKKNALALRKALAPYIEKARPAGKGPSPGRARSSSNGRRIGSAAKTTLFSELSAEEKGRFRTWANMPTARRVGDARVEAWSQAGKP